jgi:type III restriction enzyme
MSGIIRSDAKDVRLKVRNSYNPAKLNLMPWDEYLDILCENREYQKEAIKSTIIYLASGEYASIDDLVAENYIESTRLQEIYSSSEELMKKIQLPGILSGVIDLATGTGKTYVMFGVAQIMLALGIVNKVLILCPSLTIERELMIKFNSMASDPRLKELIPTDVVWANPRIIDANNTIKDGDICIENIHSVYENTGSSISESLKGKGLDTLVFNDEVHHVYNKSGNSDIKKWKSFIVDEKYGFKFSVGFTGTAYIENEYFADVIYRYSLREAMDDGFVKLVEYVAEDDLGTKYEKFQKILNNHNENKKKYSKHKPISIFITKDIKAATYLEEDFKEFLCSYANLDKNIVNDRVLLVTSSTKHKKNLIQLRSVDDIENPVEWIISVSMLTEGWDVKNVYQIVPWEDRAFNSKLLIAQVLGRGLRIPQGSIGQPKVRVFNHANWSKNIQSLVDEVLEIEISITSKVTYPESVFEVHSIDYQKKERVVRRKKKASTEVFSLKNGIQLVSQTESEKQRTVYLDIKGNVSTKRTLIKKEMISVDKVVKKIVESFKGRAIEAKLIFPDGDFQDKKLPRRKDIKEFIDKSLDTIGETRGLLTLENADKIYGRFNGLLRRKPATPTLEKRVDSLVHISINDMKSETLRYSTLVKEVGVFYSDNYTSVFTDEDVEKFEIVLDELKRKNNHKINRYAFKTALNVVFALHEPEKKFVELLASDDNSSIIDHWVKSRDRGFYRIDYQKKKGSKFKAFNPDFFIKIKNHIVVIEIKADGDVSQENRAKNRAAKRHFELLNQELAKNGMEERYHFSFLSPCDYSVFFQYLSDGRVFQNKFNSHLNSLLEQEES